MSNRQFGKVKDILEDSAKGELVEKFAEALDTKDARVVLILGIPQEDPARLEIVVWQTGHTYRYEQLGFIQSAYDMVQDYDAADDGLVE